MGIIDSLFANIEEKSKEDPKTQSNDPRLKNKWIHFNY